MYLGGDPIKLENLLDVLDFTMWNVSIKTMVYVYNSYGFHIV